MIDERLDVIDKNNNTLGHELKSVVHQKGYRHRVSAVLVRNSEGKYLIPTASKIKVEAGKLFHSAAGHVSSGESYLAAAVRELWEECGLVLKETDLNFIGTFWMIKNYPKRHEKERFEVYDVVWNENMGLVRLNNEQINEQWLYADEIKKLYLKFPKKFSYPLRLSCKKIFGF